MQIIRELHRCVVLILVPILLQIFLSNGVFAQIGFSRSLGQFGVMTPDSHPMLASMFNLVSDVKKNSNTITTGSHQASVGTSIQKPASHKMVEVTGKLGSTPDKLGPSVDADAVCAMCRQLNDLNCIRRFCLNSDLSKLAPSNDLNSLRVNADPMLLGGKGQFTNQNLADGSHMMDTNQNEVMLSVPLSNSASDQTVVPTVHIGMQSGHRRNTGMSLLGPDMSLTVGPTQGTPTNQVNQHVNIVVPSAMSSEIGISGQAHGGSVGLRPVHIPNQEVGIPPQQNVFNPLPDTTQEHGLESTMGGTVGDPFNHPIANGQPVNIMEPGNKFVPSIPNNVASVNTNAGFNRPLSVEMANNGLQTVDRMPEVVNAITGNRLTASQIMSNDVSSSGVQTSGRASDSQHSAAEINVVLPSVRSPQLPSASNQGNTVVRISQASDVIGHTISGQTRSNEASRAFEEIPAASGFEVIQQTGLSSSASLDHLPAGARDLVIPQESVVDTVQRPISPSVVLPPRSENTVSRNNPSSNVVSTSNTLPTGNEVEPHIGIVSRDLAMDSGTSGDANPSVPVSANTAGNPRLPALALPRGDNTITINAPLSEIPSFLFAGLMNQEGQETPARSLPGGPAMLFNDQSFLDGIPGGRTVHNADQSRISPQSVQPHIIQPQTVPQVVQQQNVPQVLQPQMMQPLGAIQASDELPFTFTTPVPVEISTLSPQRKRELNVLSRQLLGGLGR